MAVIPQGAGLAFHTGLVATDAGNFTLARQRIADLVVTTGRIIARDALVLDGTAPFTVTVPRGCFPVVLTLVVLSGETEPRPTHATLMILDEVPQVWEMALCPEEDLSKRPAGYAYGYPVDSWHGAFMDEEASDAQNRLYTLQQDPDLLMKEHQANDGLWNVHTFPDTRANIVTFFSGMGSGLYTSWFGRNRGGDVVCLTTDFQVFKRFSSRTQSRK